jgi:hypothetical protein
MHRVKSPERLNPKLSLKKESLQHLKVRTDLKGGIAIAANPCCTKTHHCAAGFIMQDTVIIPRR